MLCRRKWLKSLSISVAQELWFLYRRMHIKVLGRRRRWTFSCGVMELFVFSKRRSRPFSLYVLELWDLSRRRRRPKLWAFRVSSSRRRWPTLTVVLELSALRLWALRVSSRRSRDGNSGTGIRYPLGTQPDRDGSGYNFLPVGATHT
jgi:hypothetical protein